MSAFDAPRDLHFAFAREQRHRAHFAQVHPHRIVGLFADAGRQLQVEDFLALLQLLVEFRFGILENLDSRAVEPGQHVIQIPSAIEICGQNIAHFVVKNIAPLLADFHESFHPIVFVFDDSHVEPRAPVTRIYRSLSLYTARPPRFFEAVQLFVQSQRFGRLSRAFGLFNGSLQGRYLCLYCLALQFFQTRHTQLY